VRDPAGVMCVMKATKFRVELHGLRAEVVGKGKVKEESYEVKLVFIHEKGSSESFKVVYSRVRREWELDA
jgi:hypothetical protein